MNVKLVAEFGRKRKVFNLRTRVAILGRAHGNTVRIPSAEVSRRHCRLLYEKGLVSVEDMDSVNGTFLNGKRIKAVEIVRPGDRLEVGPVTFTIEYEMTPEARKRLRAESSGAVEVLEALADGEMIEADDLPVLEPLDAESVPADDEPTDLETVLPVNEDDGPIKADFDFGGTPWQLPDGGDLRDILSQMEDGDDPPPAKKPKKR